jgi:hypothetical protein
MDEYDIRDVEMNVETTDERENKEEACELADWD